MTTTNTYYHTLEYPATALTVQAELLKLSFDYGTVAPPLGHPGHGHLSREIARLVSACSDGRSSNIFSRCSTSFHQPLSQPRLPEYALRYGVPSPPASRNCGAISHPNGARPLKPAQIVPKYTQCTACGAHSQREPYMTTPASMSAAGSETASLTAPLSARAQRDERKRAAYCLPKSAGT